MEQCDIVWYEPHRKAEALRILRRLSDAEIQERRVNGVRFMFDVAPVPDEYGNRTAARATFAMRDFQGSPALPPNHVFDNGRLFLARYVAIKQLGDGLTAGNFIDFEAMLRDPAIASEAKQQAARESAAVENAEQERTTAALRGIVNSLVAIMQLARIPWLKPWRFFSTLSEIRGHATTAMMRVDTFMSPLPPIVVPSDIEGHARQSFATLPRGGKRNAA